MLKSKKAKIALFSGLGVVAVALVGGALLFGGKSSTTDAKEGADALHYRVAKEGSIASSTLLAGTVSAAEEQYVYYDATKGDITSVNVKQGDQVTAGQSLVQYDTTELQANYDTAVRARDKVGRQIYDLRTNGQTVQTTGDDATDNAAVHSAQRSVDMQLQDLNDSYADAQAALDKASAALNEATVKSTVSGTVVEVNHSVSKSNTSTNQTIVHIVNQGSLQVAGSLSEYDLANIKVDQEVKISSKVYPDQSWTGKINYISNYPSQETAGQTGSTAGSGSKYPFKATITSEVGPLKQGFSVNVEVVNSAKRILIPVAAIVNENGKNFAWTLVDGKAKKVEVQVGNSDATNQEVTSGLKAGDKVISNPNGSLKEGEKVDADEEKAN
ncbi:HlyD family secretion protein [Streptococcus gallinaceus]|uniref:efflux RND transporter periplasmic adaptor subunit n=1 Tax=Streptococcus gallinaceus TaxID=165758 RepID=UPI0020A16E55|nr:efflux RND transporter periplasmic adaptor subunit [Streptococcus gallinaceus]MCP1638969.1 HlyD family secretion protein [Streptococcus gallinaceus]MCP1769787.1 HlyD family secretion protein [Streptococcus gallinaceus]